MLCACMSPGSPGDPGLDRLLTSPGFKGHPGAPGDAGLRGPPGKYCILLQAEVK